MGILKELNRFYYQKSLNELNFLSESENGASLTYNSLLYLNTIMHKDNCTSSYIAKALNVTKSAVTVKLNELIKQGLVEKRQSQDDKRVYYITLNPKIAADLCKYDKQLKKSVEVIESKYSAPHFESFCTMFQKINDEFEEQSKTLTDKQF